MKNEFEKQGRLNPTVLSGATIIYVYGRHHVLYNRPARDLPPFFFPDGDGGYVNLVVESVYLPVGTALSVPKKKFMEVV